MLQEIIIRKVSLKMLLRLSPIVYGLCLVILYLTVFPNPLIHKVNGAARWLKFSSISIQPVEFYKLSFILCTAQLLSATKFATLSPLKQILLGFFHLSLGIPALILQPDFGNLVLILLVFLSMLYAKGYHIKFFIYISSISVPILAYMIWIKPYRLKRILSFLDPWTSIKTGGYQIIQGYLAFKNGGLFGLGLGESKQKLSFLPEAQTDFILAVIAEEFGLSGVIFTLLGLLSLFTVGLGLTLRQKNTAFFLLGLGLIAMLSLQTLLNFFVVMGLLPTKGMALPFLSLGSSSLLTYFLLVALLMRLSIESSAIRDRYAA